jgi:NADP-dependent 3-hydroxy acid dehydrogenase YdfG
MVNLYCAHHKLTSSLLTCFIVSQADQVSSTISKVVEDFGKIDVFVANAGEL